MNETFRDTTSKLEDSTEENSTPGTDNTRRWTIHIAMYATLGAVSIMKVLCPEGHSFNWMAYREKGTRVIAIKGLLNDTPYDL